MVRPTFTTDFYPNFQPILSNKTETYVSKLRTQRKTGNKLQRKVYLPTEIKQNPQLKKYWEKRFSLFSKFDEGIKLDEESWYSVTPESVANQIAKRCACNVIVDAFCGAGGNSIQFAMYCERVIAIDIDPSKIELAKNNAKIYGVEDKITFIQADFFDIASSLRANVVFLSPPWGGPNYAYYESYDLETMLQPAPLSKLMDVSRNITNNVALFLPRNSDTSVFLPKPGSSDQTEIENNILNCKRVAITVYFNKLVRKRTLVSRPPKYAHLDDCRNLKLQRNKL